MARVLALLVLVYPGLVYVGLRVMEPRHVAWLALGLVGARALLAQRMRGEAPASVLPLLRSAWLPAFTLAGTLGAAAIWNHPLGILLTPALVSFGLLLAFAQSLWRPPSLVEQIARLRVDALEASEVAYCRRVTALWCGFFLANGLVCSVLAAAASREAWATYTGGLAYLAIGLLYSVEYVYRHWRFRRYLGGLLDPLLKRVFPPDPRSRPTLSERPDTEPACRDGRGRLDPVYLRARSDPQAHSVELRVPPDLACWPGHFPGQPIVPGVLQLRWVIDTLERWAGPQGRLARIEALKFRQLLQPEDALSLRLVRAAEPGRFEFELMRGGEPAAAGRLRFESAPRSGPDPAAGAQGPGGSAS